MEYTQGLFLKLQFIADSGELYLEAIKKCHTNRFSEFTQYLNLAHSNGITILGRRFNFLKPIKNSNDPMSEGWWVGKFDIDSFDR